MRRTRRLLQAAGPLLLLVVLTGCGTSSAVATSSDDTGAYNGSDVSDVIQRPALTLPDTDGKAYALQSRPADELTVLYFGYTRCPDVCPTTMADLAAAKRTLDSADRSHVEVVFVTEDPANDSGPVIRRWLDAFDTSFIGLTGGDERTKDALTTLKAAQTVITDTPPDGVQAPITGTTVQHTGNIYVFHGTKTLVYTENTSPADYAADFHRLLDG